MDVPQPLVVSYLKLPPDEQLFSRLRDVLQTIQEKLDHLALVLAAAQDVHRSTEVRDILKNLQSGAGEHSSKVVGVIVTCETYAKTMIRLAKSLPDAMKDEDIFRKLGIFSTRCSEVIEACDNAIEGMGQLRHEIPSTVDRLKVALDNGDNKRAGLVFTEENSRVVNQLIQVIGEFPAAFHPLKEYFQEGKEHFANKEFFRENSPSEKEISAMRESWSKFSTTLAGIAEEVAQLQGNISTGPDIYKAPKLAQIWKKGASSKSKGPDSSTTPATRKAITGTDDPDTAPSEASPPVNVEASWWRTWWRRIVSCLTFKRFR
ncbi:hypothetical protein D9756_009548 [Leucocoprinus leucothites]|uniref:Uncharacterized protein n=1 Tax=Leucocoprinus leucothites TaxID=201217 RepID=A0A8H5CV07_9AGAR|nr:hypothetical protein D9756_009548 [Leucoagaricus leucothites]